MEDDSDDLAFRRVVVRVAERLTEEEVRKMIYIRLYSQREALFRNPETLEVLAVLEQAEVFSPARPEGLLDILEKDLKNRQLANLVKSFIRNKNKKSVRDDNYGRAAKSGGPSEDPEAEDDSRLRMCYKMAISQANVLVMHLEALRVATAGPSGGGVDGSAARTAVENISETAAALSRLREKANAELFKASLQTSVGGEGETAQPDYEDVDLGLNEEEQIAEPLPNKPVTPVTLPPPPQPRPRQQKPALKPKPKLNNPNKGRVTKESPRDFPRGEFNSSRSSSMPQLLEETPVYSESDGDSIDDDYICPEAIEDVIGDSNIDGQRRNSLLKKTTSLPHFSDKRKPLGISLSLGQQPAAPRRAENIHRPLPDLPSASQMEQQRDYAVLESGRESPIYDDISEHTLLSRMARPRPTSSSSSSSSSSSDSD